MLVAGFVLGLSFGAGPALAQSPGEGPWPMAGRDAAHSATVEGPAPPYREAWRSEVGLGGPVAAPVVADGAVVVVAVRGVAAFDPGTGRPLWSVARSEGPAGTPAVVGDVVVHASGRDDATALVARSVDDGGERWRAFLGASAPGGVVAAESVVAVGTRDGVLAGFDVENGDQALRFESTGRVEGTPAVAEGMIVAGWAEPSAGRVTVRAVLLSSGTEDRAAEWQLAGTPSALASGAMAVRDDTAVVVLGDGTVRGLDVETGVERWQDRLRDLPFDDQIPAAGPALLVADRLHVARLDPATGEERWAYRLADLRPVGDAEANTLSRSAPAAVGDAALIGDASGVLSAVALDSGHRVWRTDLGSEPVAAPAADGERVYVATLGSAGGVVALETDPEARRTDEVSPTVLFPLRAVFNFAVAFVLTGAVIVGLFRYVLGRRQAAGT
jgi:outer membrane protein assembly factor BamB